MPKEKYFTLKNIEKRSKAFLKRIATSYKIPDIKFYPSTSALLVIDMQDYFLNPNSHAFLPSALAIIPRVKRLIRFFHKKKDR